jgi:SAM-dependent methyltransferase
MSSNTPCRSCGEHNLQTYLDLGHTPLADRLLTPEQLQEPEPVFPLEVAFCPECGLSQILETVPPGVLFCDNYPYYSSFSPALLKHSRDNVLELIEERNLSDKSFVVELASNDGYLLKNYAQKGIPCLGIDPAEGPARAAESHGVPTLVDFFTADLAEDLATERGQADVIHANNVLAHVADTNGFVQGIATMLKDNGVAVIEAPYVKDLIEHCEFDTIYHEHLCYFSVTALDNLFRRHGLYLNRVKRLQIHGGSLRLYLEPHEQREESVLTLLEDEKKEGLDRLAYYQDFAHRVEHLKESLTAKLKELKEQNRIIAAYGAAAKGSTLINYAGIGTQFIDFVVDRNVHKHGLFMPGQHIPIYGPEMLQEKKPDYVLMLAWNFAQEIMHQQQSYLNNGGHFIIPVPEVRIY